MAKRQTLHGAIRRMADGSKQGFSDFYSGTVQFIYRSAFLLFHNHEDACRFMVDFYQYLYLHLPAYDKSVSLEKWISKLMLDRYNELSIGKQLPQQTVSTTLTASTIELSAREQERIFRQLQACIHFPKEPFHIPWKILLLVLPLLLLLLLIGYHYAPNIKEIFSNEALTEPSHEQSESLEDEASDIPELPFPFTSDDSESDQNDPSGNNTSEDRSRDSSKELPSPTADDATDSQNKPSADEPMPDSPQTPTTSDSESNFDHSASEPQSNDYEDLENLELQLHYGDSLTDRGSLTGNN
ncbi:MAG: hypothetical protein PUD20_09620 [bacterium]|nr:hypothetical protein [bacterium]